MRIERISTSEIHFQPKGTHTNFKDLDGQIFGKLTVIGYAGYRNSRGHWYCRCGCGNIAIVSCKDLCVSKQPVHSCGCDDGRGTASGTHYMTGTYVFRIWTEMRSRCNNPRRKRYKDYGGRGITVCDRWQVFENFFADMGHPPTSKHSLDRKDNNKGYSPDNCRWATQTEQANNTRKNVRITFQGKTLTMKELARELHVNYWSLRGRLRNYKWSVERA